MKIRLPLLLLSIFSAFVVAQEKTIKQPLSTLVKAEFAFARTSEEIGTKRAFLANLADDAVLFRPGPVNGREFMTKAPDSKSLLTWYPSLADVASAGDLGYTTGPYEYRDKGKDDPQVNYGYFVSIWKKQSDGRWKLFMDFGASSPMPTEKPAPFRPDETLSSSVATTGKVKFSAERAAVLNSDASFAQASIKTGLVSAYEMYGSDYIRFMRRQHFPVMGKDSTLAAVKTLDGAMTWRVIEADIARSADLGYSYGRYEWKNNPTDDKATESGNYVKLWKKEESGKWKIVLDITIPLPPTPPKSSK
jgi:ketosteroid isomerase-like protein